jgi:hypothetical protein
VASNPTYGQIFDPPTERREHSPQTRFAQQGRSTIGSDIGLTVGHGSSNDGTRVGFRAVFVQSTARTASRGDHAIADVAQAGASGFVISWCSVGGAAAAAAAHEPTTTTTTTACTRTRGSSFPQELRASLAVNRRG